MSWLLPPLLDTVELDTKHHHVTTTTTYYYKYHDYQHYTITAAAVTATPARGRSRLNERGVQSSIVKMAIINIW